MIYPSGATGVTGVLFGLAKVHKALENGIPLFHLILSAGTPTYKLAKFCGQ